MRGRRRWIFSEGRRGIAAFAAQGVLGVRYFTGAIWAGCASALLRGAAALLACFAFFSRRFPPAFVSGVWGDEPLVGCLFVHHPEQSPWQQFPDAFAGAPPEVWLQDQSSCSWISR